MSAQKPNLPSHTHRDMISPPAPSMASRFQGYLPVVVDVETAGFNAETDALLEIAAVIVRLDESGVMHRGATHACHVLPFPGANLDPASLAFTGIDPYHPFRQALDEKEALKNVFDAIRREVKHHGCRRAILVGHNAAFDLGFINAAVARTKLKRNPFHPFSTIDTVSLAALAFGQTVLARAAEAAGMTWDSSKAHSAIYDAERTADLLCIIFNRWETLQNSRQSPA